MPDRHPGPIGQYLPPNAPEPARLTEAPPPPPRAKPTHHTATDRQAALMAATQLWATDLGDSDEVADWATFTKGMLDTADQILAWLEAGSDG